VELAKAVGHEPDPYSRVEANELAERLRVAVCRLPRRQAEVFCLSCFDQMSGDEIAEQLGIRATAARMLLSRARRRLQRLLAPHGCDVKESKRTR
jgi:RNA polymerase sigma-70 factor (ECF subfamily)